MRSLRVSINIINGVMTDDFLKIATISTEKAIIDVMKLIKKQIEVTIFAYRVEKLEGVRLESWLNKDSSYFIWIKYL
jgi:hypothetical protein